MSTQEIVQVLHADAISRQLPPVVSKIVGTDPCRYCICVRVNGSCDTTYRRMIELNNGFDCGDGQSVFRDIENDPRIVPYKRAGGEV